MGYKLQEQDMTAFYTSDMGGPVLERGTASQTYWTQLGRKTLLPLGHLPKWNGWVKYCFMRPGLTVHKAPRIRQGYKVPRDKGFQHAQLTAGSHKLDREALLDASPPRIYRI